MNVYIGHFKESFSEIANLKKDEILEACRTRQIDPDELAEFLYQTIEYSKPKETTTLSKIYRDLMETFGLPWESTPGRSTLYDVTMINKEGSDDPTAPLNHEIPNFFATIADLENRHPKSARFLYDTYGIRAFHRYGSDILAKQFEQSFIDEPYGIILTLHRDDGGGFIELQKEIEDIYQQLPPHVMYRIIEAGNGIEAIRRVIKQHERFPKQDFRFGIVETHPHGGENLVFNTDHVDDPVTRTPGGIRPDHLQGTGGKKVATYFAKGAPIILTGCKSAKEGGIAEALEKATGLKIIGTQENTTFSEITFTGWNAESVPTVEVKYYNDDGRVPTKIFSL